MSSTRLAYYLEVFSRFPAVAIWLLVCGTLIFVMVLLGGATRLTDSGLSMVDWHFVGGLPPATEGEWNNAFEDYKEFPEYIQLRSSLTIDEFKRIYWFEYLHRTLGRVIGIIYAVPFLFFVVTKRVRGWVAVKLSLVLCLGGLQGLLGWFMVQSGLVDKPHVDHYRLMAHLGLAIILYGSVVWLAMDTLVSRKRLYGPSNGSLALVVLIFITILSGAMVAGLDAGFAYNTFPLMNGQLVPNGLIELDPWYINFTENIITVQFEHRMLGMLLTVFVIGQWLLRCHRSWRYKVFHLLPVTVCLQMGLGILTLLFFVPVQLAIAHQAGALILLTVALAVAHATTRVDVFRSGKNIDKVSSSVKSH